MDFLVRSLKDKHNLPVRRAIAAYKEAFFKISPQTRDSFLWFSSHRAQTVRSVTLVSKNPLFSQLSTYLSHHQIGHQLMGPYLKFLSYESGPCTSLSVQRSYLFNLFPYFLLKWQHVRFTSNAFVTLKTDNGVARFSLDKPAGKPEDKNKGKKMPKRLKMSRKAKRNELRFYRLKAKKKMTSPNPEVRIRYKLEKAKRKEEWLIEKLRKFEIPKAPEQTYDPEILTDEEKFYLKRTGEKKKNYVPVGRRGVFGGVVLNMHLHWKKHETVKVVCKPCKPGQVHEYAEELTRLSKGIVIDIKANSIIIFYRGKNYVQPKVMSPPDTLSKYEALEKYKFEQSLEHTSQFIEKLEKELEDYHKHIAMYKKGQQVACESAAATT